LEARLQSGRKKTILRVLAGVTEDYSRRIVKMTLKQIAGLGRKLVMFLGLFAGCFGRREARELLRVYVQGQLSDVHRKTAEGIALRFGKAPRTLQRFLESIKWDEEKFHDRCQQIVAQDHAHPEAIGVVDESGVATASFRMASSSVGRRSWARFPSTSTAGCKSPRSSVPGRRHCLIVAHKVLTGEVKYFVANRVPGEKGVTLRWLLRVAFGRWSVESCFRQAKDELGMDHYQVRGWRCLHRHFFLTQASHLFCARVRQEYDAPGSEPTDRLTVEQVRSATNTWLSAADLKPAARRKRYEDELKNQRYHQRRNKQARKSHTKTRIARLHTLGIDPNKIKSCTP